MTEKWSPCRPDDEHWCVVCCPEDCGLLVEIDDKKGCVAIHSAKSEESTEGFIYEQLLFAQFCLSSDCREDYDPPITQEEILEALKNYPEGEVSMPEILATIERNR